VRTSTDRKTAELGELVSVAFDLAGRYSTDPKEVARLATAAVTRILDRTPTSRIQEADELGGRDQ